MWGYDGGYGWWWWGFGALHMLLYWGVLILAIALLVKWLFAGSSRRESPHGKTALDILKERYARGEIGKEEYEQKKMISIAETTAERSARPEAGARSWAAVACTRLDGVPPMFWRGRSG